MKSQTHEQKYVDHLMSLTGNLGAMAALRRCMKPENIPIGGEYIYNFLPDEGNSWRNQCYVMVAALFATHRKNTNEMKFGECLQFLHKNKSQAKRFEKFLRSRDKAVFYNLRQLVALSKNNPINWQDLLYDLCRWGNQERWVQNKLAREFWRNDAVKEMENSNKEEIPGTEIEVVENDDDSNDDDSED